MEWSAAIDIYLKVEHPLIRGSVAYGEREITRGPSPIPLRINQNGRVYDLYVPIEAFQSKKDFQSNVFDCASVHDLLHHTGFT